MRFNEGMLPRLLIATAVHAERDAVRAGLGEGTVYPDPLSPEATDLDLVVVGVGPAAAAATTARRIALAEAEGAPYSAVLSVGVAGGFPGRIEIGDVVLGTATVAADLGVDSPDGFLSVDALGFGTATLPADPNFVHLPKFRTGKVLTVTTGTGTAERAAELAARHPDALAEAMEGYGVASAAHQAGLPFSEIRAISNMIGPRDTAAWRMDLALAALTDVFAIRESV